MPPGEKYAAEVTNILHQLVPPATVKIVRLDGRPADGGDFYDVLTACDNCKDEEVLAGLRQTVESIAADTEAEKVARVELSPAAEKKSLEPTPYPTDAFPEDIKTSLSNQPQVFVVSQ